MYESAQRRALHDLLSRKTTEPRTSFRYKVSDKFGAVHWIEGGYGWVVSGPDDKPRLKAIAERAYEQLDTARRAPPPGAARPISSCRGADRRACRRASCCISSSSSASPLSGSTMRTVA